MLQQHSFYELIINKARGKSGPVSLPSFVLLVQINSLIEGPSYITNILLIGFSKLRDKYIAERIVECLFG